MSKCVFKTFIVKKLRCNQHECNIHYCRMHSCYAFVLVDSMFFVIFFENMFRHLLACLGIFQNFLVMPFLFSRATFFFGHFWRYFISFKYLIGFMVSRYIARIFVKFFRSLRHFMWFKNLAKLYSIFLIKNDKTTFKTIFNEAREVL